MITLAVLLLLYLNSRYLADRPIGEHIRGVLLCGLVVGLTKWALLLLIWLLDHNWPAIIWKVF